MKIKVGKFYKGLINDCIIQIMATKEEPSINVKPNTMVYYVDVRTNKVGSAPLSRLENSKFVEIPFSEAKGVTR